MEERLDLLCRQSIWVPCAGQRLPAYGRVVACETIMRWPNIALQPTVAGFAVAAAELWNVRQSEGRR